MSACFFNKLKLLLKNRHITSVKYLRAVSGLNEKAMIVVFKLKKTEHVDSYKELTQQGRIYGRGGGGGAGLDWVPGHSSSWRSKTFKIDKDCQH